MTTLSYKKHILSILKLAYPVSLGQVGIMIAGLSDNIMVGLLSYEHLAASALANAIQIIFLFFGTGFSIAITSIVGQAFGARNSEKVENTFRVGFFLNTFMGIILCGLMASLYFFLDHFGQEVKVVELARPYMIYLALTIIPHMIFMHFKQFTEGLQKTVPAMAIGLTGNALNIILNYLLIYGKFGFPEMGLNGAGLATLLFRIFIVGAFFSYFFAEKKYRHLLAQLLKPKFDKTVSSDIVKTGLPIGAQFSMEAAGFALSAIMVGWISSTAQAAHQIAMNIASITYLAASGLSSAATISISNYLGEQKFQDLRKAGFSSFIVVILFMTTMAILIVIFRNELPKFFVEDQNVAAMATQLLIVAALFQLFDGVQVVGLGTQRGIKDVYYPTVIALIAYWIIGMPSSYFFGFHLGYGAIGVWLGIAIGLGLAAIALFVRFYVKTNIAVNNSVKL